MEVARTRVCSCYFSPGDALEVSKTQIHLLEESLSEDTDRILIAGDYNSKSPEWGKIRLDRTPPRDYLIALNRG